MEMVGQGGRIPPMKISGNFIYFYSISKPSFNPLWHALLSSLPPFERRSTTMGGLDIEPVYSTLFPSITSTPGTSKFHLNTLH